MANLDVRVWDVGHGLSVWIQTPNRQNHWIDAGFNPDPEFSPSEYVAANYENAAPIHFLVISHPDKDHIDHLHTLLKRLGKPMVLLRNKSLPESEKFGSCQFEYQKAFKELDGTYNSSVSWEKDPMNPACNGGVLVRSGHLGWQEVPDLNNSSVVMMYFYNDTLIVFPGDIEELGWELLQQKKAAEFSDLVEKAHHRILVAPHHGRGSGYSQKMMDFIKPDIVIISDEYGREPTDRRFREKPTGLHINGVLTKFISTKSNGRARIVVGDGGLALVE